MTDERDLRDPALDAAWRAQPAETPPPALDAAILAAAHRAVKSAPSRIGPGTEATRWRGWMPLLAAAAIGAIAVGVLQLAPHEPDATKAIVTDVPADAGASRAPPPPSTATPASPPPPIAVPSAPSPSAAPSAPSNAGAKPQAQSAPARTAPTPPVSAATRAATPRPDAPAPAASAAPDPFPARRESAPSGEARGAVERKREADDAAPAARERATDKLMQSPSAAPAPAAAGAAAPAMAKRAARDDAQAARTPEDWIARIRARLADNDAAGAQRELAAFRAAFADADARLPTDLRPWAAGVPRASP